MEIEVLSCNWNGNGCYLGFMTYDELVKIVNTKIDQSMNRKIKPERVKDIVQYMKENAQSIFFPPVILNSLDQLTFNKNKYDKISIKLNNNCLSIIDGQHRINAIKDMLKDEPQKRLFSQNKIPFLLIENLQPMEHRNLFNLINDNSTNVEATVSARFDITMHNYFGLKYINEDIILKKDTHNSILIKNHIEWEQKQSNDKICYIFITEVNNCIIKYINKNIGSSEEVNDDKIYTVLKMFWDIYFKHILNLVDKTIRGFYIKKVTLFGITKYILNELSVDEEGTGKLDTFDKINESISFKLPKILHKNFIEDYTGEFKQRIKSYEDIINYLLNLTEIQEIETM